ncbi:MAG: HlyD family efflux transporter periplasmic adaptor subunit [Selenomonadaceae bacterium]|nr:HlyD family efflux transporter periplasmic adaptor subunit [Selenomonadaceae bacterium]
MNRHSRTNRCLFSTIGELEVAIDIPESKIADITINQPVTVTFWAISNSTYEYVREIAPIADASSITFAVKIAVPNPPPQMQLGMTESIAVLSNSSIVSEMTIPLSAVY